VSPQRQPPAWRWAHRFYLLPTTRGVHGGGEGALRIMPTRRRCGAGGALQCALCRGSEQRFKACIERASKTNPESDAEGRALTPSNGSCRLAAEWVWSCEGARASLHVAVLRSITRKRLMFGATVPCGAALTMSRVDWVLDSEDCNGSGLESEQPGPQPCQHKLLSCNGCATWFQNQWGNS
jgi:hypothetical protein